MQYMTQRKRYMADQAAGAQQQAAGEHLAGFVRSGTRNVQSLLGGSSIMELFSLIVS